MLWHRLPEADPALALAAQAYYGAPLLLPVAGTQAAIQALPRLRAPSRITVAAPSYAEHAHHWSAHGHMMRQVPYDALAAAIEHSDVVVLCNPNNPTGATVPGEQLLDWAAQLARRGGWLVVDEAFADTAPANSVAASSAMPGLIVLRSVGKFFGLAGARLGFVGAPPALLEALHEQLGPWTISAPAQQIGIAALRDRDWQQSTRLQLAASGDRLRQMLAAASIDSARHGPVPMVAVARSRAVFAPHGRTGHLGAPVCPRGARHPSGTAARRSRLAAPAERLTRMENTMKHLALALTLSVAVAQAHGPRSHLRTRRRRQPGHPASARPSA